jgi:drug/metabolite transporter (DMT)-like permease
LQKTQPLFALLLANLWLRERVPGRAWIWVPFALLGAYLIVIPDPLHPEQAFVDFHVAAGLLAVGAAALWGCATVFGRYALAGVRFTTLTALRFTFGLPALALSVLLIGGPAGFTAYRLADLPLYLGLALLPGGLGLLLYYRGLSSTPASLATLAELAFPITGVLVNLYLVTPRQSITAWQVAGIAVLWLAIAALDLANARQPARLQAAAG